MEKDLKKITETHFNRLKKPRSFRKKRPNQAKGPAPGQNAISSQLTKQEVQTAKITLKREQKKQKRASHRKAIINNLEGIMIQTPLKAGPFITTASFDVIHNIIRAVIIPMSMKTTIFLDASQVTPMDMRFYLFALFLMFLKRVGKVNGFYYNLVPDLVESNLFPKSYAKILQYYAPFCKTGSVQSFEFVFDTDYISPTQAVGYGDGFETQFYNATAPSLYNYSGQITDLIMPMTSVPTPTTPSSTIPASQIYFALETATGIKFTDWIVTPSNFTRVETALATYGINTVNMTFFFGPENNKRPYAPDASAHTVLSGTTTLQSDAYIFDVPVGLDLLNMHSDYDPEFSLSFCWTSNNATFPSSSAKPVPLPCQDYNSLYSANSFKSPFPWWFQPLAVAIWLADNTDHLAKGKISNLRISGAKVYTLFPNARAIAGPSFTTLLGHAYQRVQAEQEQAKTTPTVPGVLNDDGVYTNWWLLYAGATQALQRRFNETEVIYANYPILAGTANPICAPQFNWVDKTALDVRLPYTLKDYIEKIGPVIHDGRLYIPQNTIQNQTHDVPYPVVAADAYGPIAMSAFGWNPASLANYTYENLQTPVSFNGPNASSSSPIPINAVLDGITFNSALQSVYMGWDATNGKLYPAFLSGNYQTAILTALDKFMFTNNTVNTSDKNYGAPCPKLLGAYSAMTSEVITNPQSAQFTPLAPANLPPNSTTFNSDLHLVRTPIVGLTSPSLLASTKVVSALVNGIVEGNDQLPAGGPNRLQKVQIIQAFANRTALPTLNTVPPQGLYNLVNLSGNSVTALLSQITHSVIRPDSPIGKQIEKIDMIKSKLGQVIPPGMQKQVDSLSAKKVFNGILQAASSKFFANQEFTTTAHALGPLGKGMPDSIAGALAIIKSNLTSASTEGVASNKLMNPQMQTVSKGIGIIKKATKAVKVVSDLAKKLIGDATHTVSGVHSDIKKGIEDVSSIFDE